MKTALFLMVPHLSHYYPTFGLARTLRMQGYTVIYSGTANYKVAVEQEGFLFRPVSYVEEIIVRKLRVVLGLLIKTLFEPTWAVFRYRNFLKNMQTIEQLVFDIKPDIIFFDDTLGHYYPCLLGKAMLVQLSTRLSPRRHSSLPPLNSFYIPRRWLIDSLIANIQWWWHIRLRRLNEKVQSIAFQGRSDFEFQHRYERQRGIEWSMIRDENVAFYDAVAVLPTLVLAPKSLEFEHAQAVSNEHYLYIPYARNEQVDVSTEYIQWKERIIYRKQAKKTKLVFVSLGTLSLNQSEKAYRLLTNIINALSGNDAIDVLIATGGIDLQHSTRAATIYCLPTVPQLDVLTLADLMITHGGFGSVKESVAAGVPMLVFPLNTHVDQPGNSARVVCKGLGLRGKATDTPAMISRKVYTLLNTPFYRENCQSTRHSFLKDEQAAVVSLEHLCLLNKDLSISNHINQYFTTNQLQL